MKETKFTKIQKGYRFTAYSLENDGDFYNSEILEGLTSNEVENAVKLCKLMKSKCSNLYAPSEEEKIEVYNEVNKIFNIINNYVVDQDNLEEFEEDFIDIMQNFGFIGEQDGQFTRYCSGYKVELVPEDILIEDFTWKFK